MLDAGGESAAGMRGRASGVLALGSVSPPLAADANAESVYSSAEERSARTRTAAADTASAIVSSRQFPLQNGGGFGSFPSMQHASVLGVVVVRQPGRLDGSEARITRQDG